MVLHSKFYQDHNGVLLTVALRDDILVRYREGWNDLLNLVTLITDTPEVHLKRKKTPLRPKLPWLWKQWRLQGAMKAGLEYLKRWKVKQLFG